MIERAGKQYLTVKEFSELAGISKQAVYSQLSTRLEQFSIQVDNRTMIEKSAFDVFYSSQLEQVSSQVKSSQVNPNSTQNEGLQQGQAKDDISKELIEMLKEEIKKKDQQIEKLQNSLDKAYTQIADMAQKAQYITAADKTEKIMQQQSKEEIMESAPDENHITKNYDSAENNQERGIIRFLKRLFSFE